MINSGAAQAAAFTDYNTQIHAACCDKIIYVNFPQMKQPGLHSEHPKFVLHNLYAFHRMKDIQRG